MDKINKLPDELLVKILSYLPTKVAVSTSVLSKRWKFLWMWLSKLDYGNSWTRREPPRDFIDKNLPLHKAPVIESLRLVLQSRDIKPEDIKLWVEIAVSRHVRELEISYWLGNIANILPSSLFTCKSLVILKLEDVTIKDVPSMASCLHPLKTLHLSYVTYADEESFQELLSIFPVLENLDMSFDDSGIERVKKLNIIIPSLQKLSLFIPGACTLYGYEIDTPSLKYLKLDDRYYMEDYSLCKNLPELMEAYVDALDLNNLIRSITSVKHLTICSQDVYGDGIVFNQLEHLKLCICKKYSSNLLAQLLKDSPNLRVLDISVFEDHGDKGRNVMVRWNQPNLVPECMLSSLQIFSWSGYFGRPQDRDIAVYILKNARYLRRATISADTREHRVSNLQMIKELALSSRASNKCELIFVQDEVDVIDCRSDDSRT